MLSAQAPVSIQMAEYMLVLGQGRGSSTALEYSNWSCWVISLRCYQLISPQVTSIKHNAQKSVCYSIYYRTTMVSAPREARGVFSPHAFSLIKRLLCNVNTKFSKIIYTYFGGPRHVL